MDSSQNENNNGQQQPSFASDSMSAERRRSSIDERFANLHNTKRGNEATQALKSDLHEQYAPAGTLGKMWNKFARGTDVSGPSNN